MLETAEQCRSYAVPGPHTALLADCTRFADPAYWAALEGLGYRQVNVLLPTKPLDATLKALDAIAGKVAAYRG